MDTCPHCGASIPPVRDAFCQECLQALDEPPRSIFHSAPDVQAVDRRFPVAGLLCGAALGLFSGCGTMAAASQSLGYVGASGALIGQMLGGALLGFAVGLIIGRGR
jgi:hypothetical protein